MKFSRSLSVLIAVIVVATALYGGGWQINEHGARSMGFGGAWASRALDLSAMYSNAAGLTNMKGINVMLGGTIIMPSSKFQGPGAATTVTEMKSQTFFPPNLYGSYQVNEKLFVGLGVFAPFGLGTEWDPNWVGRRLSVKSDMQVIYVNPTVAYKINDQLSVGGGISLVFGSVELSYRVPTYSSLAPPTPSATDGTASLEADASTAVSFNLGVLYKFNDKLSVGASYRTLADVEFKGTAKFTGMSALQTFFPGGDGSAKLPMPSNLQIGVSYQVMPKLVAAFDFQYVGWSAYEKLEVKIANGPASPLGVLQTSPAPSVQNYDDGMLYRFGAEYEVNDKLMVRGGLVFDMTPQPTEKMEPRLPDWDKTDVTLGAGYKVNENITVDVAYMMILSTGRYGGSAAFNGLYTSGANLFAANVSYAF